MKPMIWCRECNRLAHERERRGDVRLFFPSQVSPSSRPSVVPLGVCAVCWMERWHGQPALDEPVVLAVC